jgi:hypothetical protein
MAARVFHSWQWPRRVCAGARKTLEVIFAKSTAFQFASIECYETLSRCENRLKQGWEKLGRGGTDDELGKPLIAVQRVKVPPD